MIVKIEFIKEFANKKKGDVMECDSILASNILGRGFAKVYKEVKKRKTKELKVKKETK